VVRLRDPAGFVVEAVWGRAGAPELPHRAPLVANQGGERARVNATQRPPAGPPEVLRLGHVVLEVADYQATSAFYTRHFGLIPSDVQVLPDGSPAVTFFRLDRGETPTDHHTLALAQGLLSTFSHAAFEVVDADAVGVGHRVLRERGYQHAWGLGRHILGSQLFDYWSDPWGDKFEHYCDGDLFTAEATVLVPSRHGLVQVGGWWAVWALRGGTRQVRHRIEQPLEQVLRFLVKQPLRRRRPVLALTPEIVQHRQGR
jgi:catechol 2,3-dioxygenase-like lactoylglutathione lyase family enzyme